MSQPQAIPELAVEETLAVPTRPVRDVTGSPGYRIGSRDVAVPPQLGSSGVDESRQRPVNSITAPCPRRGKQGPRVAATQRVNGGNGQTVERGSSSSERTRYSVLTFLVPEEDVAVVVGAPALGVAQG